MIKLRAHPLTAVGFIAPFWAIFLLPVLRRFLSGSHTVAFVAEGLMLAFVILQGFFRARALEIIVSAEKICLRRGVIRKEEVFFAKNAVSCLSVRENPLLSLFSTVSVQINTEAGRWRSDYKIILKKRDAERLRKSLGMGMGVKSIRMGAERITLMSAAMSSAAVGVLLAAPMIARLVRLLDIGISNLLLETARKTVISSSLIYFAMLFIFFYCVSFVSLLIRSLIMKVGFSDDSICVSSGLLPRRYTFLKKDAVNIISLEQKPLLRLTKRVLIRVGVAGCGGKRQDDVVVPIARKNEIEPFLQNLFSLSMPSSGISPGKGTRYRFVRWPLFFLATVPTAAIISGVYVPKIAAAAVPMAVISLLFFAYLSNLSLKSSKATLLSSGGGYLFAAGARGMSFRRVFCRGDRIGMFKIRRWPKDLKNGSCVLTVFVRSKRSERIKLKFIDFAATEEYCRAFWKR
ncbi:MAG: hypothetical protein IJ426_04735 [Clostridia bacterium]|nr:hypothetical protein [Clostridia bacterium]